MKLISLFFSTLLLLNAIIFSLYHHDQKEELRNEIFNKIKLYNYTFEDKNIVIDVVKSKDAAELFTLKIEKNEIFAYFNIPNSKQNSLKIIYDFEKYQEKLDSLALNSILNFLLSSLVLIFLSLAYSLFALKPLKEAINLLEVFLKDIIHDLNTPITSILLNLKILSKKPSTEAIKRIEYSAKSIGSLYKNLEANIHETTLHIEDVDIQKLLQEKIEYFSYLYPHVQFSLELKNTSLQTSYDALSIILENLLSNACKYTKENAKVTIKTEDKTIWIQDNGIGIKDVNKVFDRFYKESDRGLGLGLDIVKKLCHKLNIDINLKSSPEGTTFELTLR
ncbi:MAG: HAMP domain-containing histidine kinase [Sulfurospirillum sp.]|nr:HAMP domain-containing histidine kinase [Sulfurospirillum sp.]